MSVVFNILILVIALIVAKNQLEKVINKMK